jgi:FecR protein/SPOR domain
MKRTIAVLLAALLAGFGQIALAQRAAVVEGVQMPAWLERRIGNVSERKPLAVGMELKSGDSVITGAGSRALVKLSEGSTVKLGENGSLLITEMNAGNGASSGGIFKAAMRIAEGAFRFTTDALAKTRRREVSIRVATVTAGIRGTDLWGKSTADRQVVCLIEGAIEVGADGEKPALMDQARQFYRRENGQTQPIGFVEAAQLVEWAKETDIEAGKGAARRGGKWKVILATVETQAAALAVYDGARDNGYAAEIRPAKAGDQQVYHVRIANLPSKAEGEMLAASLRGRFGIVEPRVSN